MTASSVEVRRCLPGDEAALSLIAGATFLEAFAQDIPAPDIVTHAIERNRPAYYADLLRDPASACFLAELPLGAPVGYAVITTPDFTDIALGKSDIDLKRIYLLAPWHGGGAAARLMDAAIASACEHGYGRMLIGCYRDNHRALAFYAKHGFAQVGTRRFTVGNQTYDDVVLARPLD